MKKISITLLILFCTFLLNAERSFRPGGGSRCAITVTTSSTDATCFNNDGAATVTPTSGTPPYTYFWHTADVTQSITGLAGGNYYVTVTDAGGCTASAIVTISTATIPVTVAANKTVMCSGDSAQLCVTAGFTGYLWNTGESTPCIQAKLSGNYYVTVTDNGGCTAVSNVTAVQVYPIPPVSVSVSGDTLSGYNAVTYQWYLNSAPIPGATFQTYIIPFTGVYKLGVTDSNGCFAMSNNIYVIKAVGNINGNIYQDANRNCINDSSDVGLKNIPVQLWKNGGFLRSTISRDPGFYIHDVDTFDTYELMIDTANLPFVVTCPANGRDTAIITQLDSVAIDKNFGLECKGGFDLVAQSVSGFFRPADIGAVYINAGEIATFYKASCAGGISGTVTVAITGPVTYLSPASGAPAPSSVAGNTLTWNIADFSTVNFASDFNIVLQTDTFASLASQVCFDIVVTPTAGDNNPANNTLTQCFMVRGSFDPNDKQVYPDGNIDTAQKWLTYTIRFQNTGTAEAQHIRITDTLDSDLDASSFQLLGYSHQPIVDINERAMTFSFPNINLPDSNANEPGSHGYIQYRVKIKNGKPIGTQINNTAFIYFDFNAPVVTNTTSNTIAIINSIADTRHKTQDFRLFPNPASNSFTISVDERMVGATATITDVTGRKMLVAQLSTVNRQLSTSDFANGVYFVTVNNGNIVTKKLIISK